MSLNNERMSSKDTYVFCRVSEPISHAFDILKTKGSNAPANLILISGSDSFGEHYLLKARYHGDLSPNVL